eukprot:4865078-Pyramimonas_sp.AAC.1
MATTWAPVTAATRTTTTTTTTANDHDDDGERPRPSGPGGAGRVPASCGLPVHLPRPGNNC